DGRGRRPGPAVADMREEGVSVGAEARRRSENRIAAAVAVKVAVAVKAERDPRVLRPRSEMIGRHPVVPSAELFVLEDLRHREEPTGRYPRLLQRGDRFRAGALG